MHLSDDVGILDGGFDARISYGLVASECVVVFLRLEAARREEYGTVRSFYAECVFRVDNLFQLLGYHSCVKTLLYDYDYV